MNLSGSIILFMLIGLLTINTHTSYSSEYESLKKEHYAKAVQQFNEGLYFKDQKQSDRQLFIDSYTGRKNFTVSSDEVQYSETSHFNFPYTANRETYYKNTNYKNEYIVVNQLFIYEDIRGMWLPLSTIKQTFKDGKDISRNEQDLWDEKNDWAEVFKKEHISNEDVEDFIEKLSKLADEKEPFSVEDLENLIEKKHTSDKENKEREKLLEEIEELIEKLE